MIFDPLKHAQKADFETKLSQESNSPSVNQCIGFTKDKMDINMINAQTDVRYQSVEIIDSISDLKPELNTRNCVQTGYPSKDNDNYNSCIRRRKET